MVKWVTHLAATIEDPGTIVDLDALPFFPILYLCKTPQVADKKITQVVITFLMCYRSQYRYYAESVISR
jgi:hypothetical protein